jgi:hypothetical protein
MKIVYRKDMIAGIIKIVLKSKKKLLKCLKERLPIIPE